MSLLVVTIIGGVALGATYALIALGIVLIFRATATFNFAQGQMMLLGAYLVGRWQLGWDAPNLVVLISALAVVAFFGWLIYQLILRRITGAPPFIGVIATLGVAAVADGIFGIVFGANQYKITYPWLPSGTVTILGAGVSTKILLLAAVGLVLAAGTAALLHFARIGAQLRAAGQDVLLASQSGINVHRVHAFAWALGCALAGFAGIAYGTQNIVSGDMVALGLVAFPAILLGGIDSVGGSIVGGILCGLLQAFTASYIGGGWTIVMTYVVLLVVMLVKPSGLFGTQSIVRV